MDNKTIGQRLRNLRGDTPLIDVCAAIGVSRAALSNYELGLRIPRDEIKVKIAEYYNQSIESIFYS